MVSLELTTVSALIGPLSSTDSHVTQRSAERGTPRATSHNRYIRAAFDDANHDAGDMRVESLAEPESVGRP